MKSPLDFIFNIELSRAFPEPFWLKSGTSIYIYGTGTAGQDVWRVLSDKGILITGYMDHRTRENPFIAGVPILPPDSSSISEKAKSVIVLAIHNREVDMRALIARLKALGYTQFISMIDLYDHFATELGTRYWLTSRTFYRDQKTQINAANQLWTDDLSRDTYAKTLEFRVSGDFSFLPEPDMVHQYFPPDLPPWKQPIRMIDCGAYDGDAIRDFIKNGHSFSALAAFEPDEANFRKLVETIRENHIPNAVLWLCGVYSSTTQLHFSAGQGEASVITTTGESVIQCVSLDESAPYFAPTLIKMDIEGAESDALRGAENTIAAYHPGLAISIYHLPAHLWEIPLWVAQFAAENGLRYTYYLRSHAHNCFDTVFYAVPTI